MAATGNPHNAFPPAGKLVNVAAFKPLSESKIGDLGGFQLEHCYEDLLAYLMNMVATDDMSASRNAYKVHCESILVQFNVRDSPEAKAAEAWRFKEGEEDDRDELGHSVTTRGKELLGLSLVLNGGADKVFAHFQKSKLKCTEDKTIVETQAVKDRTMTLYNIRAHLRIVRRSAAAVWNPVDPKHEYSALYYWEKVEAIFGRSSTQAKLTESLKGLDQFQAALPSNDDLRDAAEVFFIASLRGASMPWTTREVASFAKSCLMVKKIPKLVIQALPSYCPKGCLKIATPITSLTSADFRVEDKSWSGLVLLTPCSIF